MDFHAALFSASGNSLIDILSTIIGPVLQTSFQLQGQTDPSFESAVQQHETLYAAVARGDGDGARQAMEAILQVAGGEVAALGRQTRGAA
jgi:DNA-binding FadR family transcriptional regulator